VTSPQSIAAGSPLSHKKGIRIDHLLLNRWARLSIPSLSDLFFVALLVWVCMSGGAAGWEGLLADADIGWHIRTGEWIIDHHAVPHQDLYSFSKAGATWYAWEWGSDVIYGGLHRMAGLKGVTLLAGVLIALFGWTLLRRMVGRGVHLLWAMIVSLLGVGAASIHFLARPHLFTLLFLSIAVWMIELDRTEASEKSARRLWLLVPLTVVWTNLHGGFLALIAVLGLTAVGVAVEAFIVRGSFRTALRYLALAAACAAASLINPYGYHLHVHVAQYLRSDWIRNTIQEFQSPIFRSENILQFEALMLIGLVATGLLFRRRRIVEGLWIVYFAHM
jgi:type IV secretory pathway VirB2 component (pilin)